MDDSQPEIRLMIQSNSFRLPFSALILLLLVLLFRSDLCIADIDLMRPSPCRIADGSQHSADFGSSVASAGDVNKDGYDDIIVGVPSYSNGNYSEGGAFVFLGSVAGFDDFPSWMNESNVFDAHFGLSVASAGDVNGDGYSDVIIGAPLYSNGENFEGAAFVFLGSQLGLFGGFWVAEGNQENSRFGYSVASAGDVNGDGYSDVIIGAQKYTNGQEQEGAAFVFLGSASGLSSEFDWMACAFWVFRCKCRRRQWR
jgi:hypothetical protein